MMAHTFLVTFESEEDLEAYGPHAAHQALVKLLPPVLAEVRVLISGRNSRLLQWQTP